MQRSVIRFTVLVFGLAVLVASGQRPTEEVVAQVAPPQQGDHTFRITHIKFDHVGPDSNGSVSPTDALNIRKDAGSDLVHTGNGAGDGEWVRGGRSEEACYITDKLVSIKVRIECDDYLRSAAFWAVQKGFDPTLPQSLKPWLEVDEKSVDFTEKVPGLWVSRNNTPGASDPEYVDFPLSNPTRPDINKSICTCVVESERH